MPVEYADVEDIKKVLNPAKRPDDGYGSAIPTNWQVKIKGEKRYRKILAVCYSNVVSYYVNVKDKALYIRYSDFPTH